MKAQVVECNGGFAPKYFALRVLRDGILITLRITRSEYLFILEDIVGPGKPENHPKMKMYFEKIANCLEIKTEVA